MASLAELLGGAIQSGKQALGLGSVNLFPGDVNKTLTGVPAQQAYQASYGGPQYNPSLYQASGSTNPRASSQIITNPTPTGDILGTSTDVPNTSSGPSPEDIYKQQQIENISNKWGGYFSSLDQLMGQLPGQAGLLGQEAGILSGQQVSDLTASTQENQAALNKQTTQAETGQVKSLKDISANIRNLMQAGNTYLGSMGAGDSSAVNQYAYALTKLGSQARGDVISQTKTIMDNINDRLSKVGNIFTQEKNRIDSELNLAKNNISQWLVDQQNAITQAKASGELQKGEDIQALTDNLYNIAVQNLTQYQNWYQDKMGALQTWALNNSTSLKEAQAKLANAGSFTAPQQTYAPINGMPQFGAPTQTGGYGGWSGQSLSDEEKRRLGLA